MEARLTELKDKLDLSMLFGNSNPVEIEIGCGKGRFIIQSAMENPGLNYLGIEVSNKYFQILKQRALNSSAKNIRLHKGEAGCFIEDYIPDCSVKAYHVYFPDPWPKRRHHKRRLVNADFIARVEMSLIQGGNILFATDFKDYFRQIVEVSRAWKGLEEIYCNVISPSEVNPEEAVTNYERKYLLQGRQIYKAGYRKK
jgi:tRNA (guanine-N7-)-methyltransferase